MSDAATTISWHVKITDQPFNFYIISVSDRGYRLFNHASVSHNHGLHPFTHYYIHHGLAQNHTVNMWRIFIRDLSWDLHDTQPDIGIVEIHGIIFTHSADSMPDDVVLYSPEEVIIKDSERLYYH
jgi:hypothetical protein